MEMERNIRLYPLFRIAADGYAWIPVFFLYMSQTQSLEKIIQLSAIYYFAVFLLEVPSGYFSDRFGRRRTLLLAAASLIFSYTCFIIGGSFWWFAFGQVFLASGIAMQSGTDSAFLYDSLCAAGREDEYAQHEARAEQYGLSALAVACLCGGLLGTLDLRLAYLFCLASALIMVVLVWKFTEPDHVANHDVLRSGFLTTLAGCVLRLRNPVLLWLFCLSIVLYALAHIVYELYQPYITLLDWEILNTSNYAPLISGVVIAVSMFGGALGARISTTWLAGIGLVGLTAAAMLIQLGIVAVMASSISAFALLLVCARNFPMALVHAPVRAAIAPRISRLQRATYLSLQGLAERIVFALLLVSLSLNLLPGSPVDESTLLEILRTTFWLGLVSGLALYLFWKTMARYLKTGG